MKRLMAIGFLIAMANVAVGQSVSKTDEGFRFHARTNPAAATELNVPGSDDLPYGDDEPSAEAMRAASLYGSGSNLSYHGGAVLHQAQVVEIYWGSYWTSGTGAQEQSSMQA